MLPETVKPATQLTKAGAHALLGRLQSALPQIISSEVPTYTPDAGIASLLGAIQHALAACTCPVVHFTSAYGGEGSTSISFELALAAAQQGSKRVLFLNMNNAADPAYRHLSQRAGTSLEAFFHSDSPGVSPLVILQGTSLFYADFSKTDSNSVAALDINFVRSVFEDLRNNFDMIVLASEAAMTTGSSGVLSALADGSVIVVEAERTRSPVAQELKAMLETAGGRVIGAVLNKRRFYIPRWVYNLLFGGRGL